jgi:hypothetical protein
MKSAPKPSLRTTELARIHAERQSAIIATILQELPDPIPKHCLKLLSHAPESFDDLRYGAVATAAYNLHLNHRPVSILTVQEELARAPARADLTEVFNFLKLRPMPLSAGILEWECEELWHAYSYRQQATVLYEGSQALIATPAQADSIIAHVRRAIDDLSSHQNNGDGLPEIVDGATLMNTDPILPQILVHGLLHLGSKLSLGGSSKAYKSWGLLNLALSVSTGTPWLGFETTRARVLYINFEIDARFMHHRLNVVSRALNIQPDPGYLDLWNLRGKSTSHAQIIPKIIARSKQAHYGLTIIDPSYKLMGNGSDENSPADVGSMLNSFELIATETESSVAYGAHFSKGNQSAKDAIDRVSGSGVFARDPDTVLTFTKHEQDNCFTLEATPRNLPPVPPIVVKWNYPLFTPQPDLDPTDLKKKPGPPRCSSIEAVRDLLLPSPLPSKDWQIAASDILHISRASFFRIQSELSQKDMIIYSKITHCWTPVFKQ